VASDDEMAAARADALATLIDDASARKLVIAGPGTGKTYAFKNALAKSGQPALALTFLNSLVEGLQADVGDLADVYSFHGFSRRLLHTTSVLGVSRDVDYYPAIDLVYAADLGLAGGGVTLRMIGESFMNLEAASTVISDVLRSGSYYNAVGHTDSVYRVLRHLQADPSATPAYALVVVDEYQDFSLLETELIEALAEASPILVAGDDDQALFGFRHASAIYLRDLARDERYTNFELPFCSRCTEVMVQATHRVVDRAQAAGILRDRLSKEYICFLPDKREANQSYPRIKHARCSVETNRAPYVGRYVADAIQTMSGEDIGESRAAGNPAVLVIGPKQFVGRVYELLATEFADVRYKMSTQLEIRPIDGYQRLMADAKSRLGWRILLSLDQPAGWDEAVREALVSELELVDLISADYRDTHMVIVEILQRLATDGEVAPGELSAAMSATGMSLRDLLEELGLGQSQAEDEDPPEPEDGLSSNEPRILVTSLMGAKGLQADHVFVLGLNEGHFPQANNAPTEDEVCQLLVALTRGRKSCTLVSTGRFGKFWLKGSIFLDWLEPLLEEIVVEKRYFAG
jgi:superfamily I DNA/RNA helicase